MDLERFEPKAFISETTRNGRYGWLGRARTGHNQGFRRRKRDPQTYIRGVSTLIRDFRENITSIMKTGSPVRKYSGMIPGLSNITAVSMTKTGQ